MTKNSTRAVRKEPPKPIDIYVGKVLRSFRKKAGMSQGELGKRLGEGDSYRDSLTYQQIQNYENGLNKISGGTLYQLSQIFDIEINAFFNGFKNSDEAQPEYLIMQKLRSITNQGEKEELRNKMLLLINQSQKHTY